MISTKILEYQLIKGNIKEMLKQWFPTITFSDLNFEKQQIYNFCIQFFSAIVLKQYYKIFISFNPSIDLESIKEHKNKTMAIL